MADTAPTLEVGQAHEGRVWGFLGWVLVGGLVSLGVLALLSIGIVLIAAGVVVAVVLLLHPGGRGAARLGLLSGMGLPLLYVAALNREGPGDVCHDFEGGVKCEQQWSPWPFLAVGLGLVVAGVVLYVLAVRRGQPSRGGLPASPDLQ